MPSRRNILMVVMFWQLIRMRYILEQAGGRLHTAFNSMDEQISQVVNHRVCPRLLSGGYSKLKRVLASMSKSPS
ncbi:unnamed protein product [Chrysoparadoxa australica]